MNRNSIPALQGERMLSVREAAQVSGFCLDTVRRNLRSGLLPGVKTGHSWRISESQLALYLQANRNEYPANFEGPQAVSHSPSGESQMIELLDTLLRTETVQSTVVELVATALKKAGVRLGPSRRILKELGQLLDEI